MDFQHIEATFGKLEYRSLSFSKGLNIIEAPNESGKSTLLAFLRVMLYGFPPRERGALADKNRYAPWSLSPMRGTLALTCQKGDITLQRDTARANSPMGRFSAVYTGSSETVDGLTAADCGETLLGVPCEVYERSAFIRQSSLTVDASAELERRIAALITTGEEGQSFSEASAALKKQLNARKYNKSGRIPALAAEISAQERALEELSQLTRSKRKAEEALASFDAEEASLREQLRAHDLCDAQDARRAAAEVQQAWQSTESKAEYLRRALIEQNVPARDALEQGRARLNALSSLKVEATDAQKRCDDAEAALSDFDARPAERPHSLLPYIIVSAVLLLLFIFVSALPSPVALAGCIVSGAALAALLVLNWNNARKVRAAHEEKRGVLEQALRDARSDAAAQQKLYDAAVRELLVLIPAGDISRVGAYLDAALQKYAELDALTREARDLSLRCELLSARAPKAALADEGIDLEIVQFSDYVTPNNALANGDIDLNAFQHRIYLQNEIDNYGYAIQNIGNTFIIPLNLYSQKVSSVDELKDGDVVAIPDDLTNGGRALKVLEAAGLIELNPNAAFNPTVDDITSYKVNITIEELKANTIPSVLPDVAAAVVNGNYALDFGLKTDEAIYKDSVLDVEDYWNLIAARTADVEDPDTAAIYEKVVEAFQSSATEDVFNNTFGGYFIAVGWDQDLINQ